MKNSAIDQITYLQPHRAQKKEKLAIVTNGGGMNCAYSAGALCALAKVHNLRTPDILVGSSGSTGSLAYYSAGQYASMKNIWTNLLTAKEFISMKRFSKIMDIDYLVDVIFREKDPLDVSKVHASHSQIFIAATECQKGTLKFFSAADDIFEALRASKAIPIITNKKVTIDDREYIDGSISSSFDQCIDKAITEGAGDIIVISDGEDLSLGTSLFWYVYSFFVSSAMRKVVWRHCQKDFYRITQRENINIITISPSRRLKTHALNNNKGDLMDTFLLGYSDAENDDEIKEFLRCHL